jgi:glycogen phosphorylase
VREFYHPACEQYERLSKDDFQAAAELSLWKKKVHQHWPNVSIRMLSEPVNCLVPGQHLQLDIVIKLGQLLPADVCVDCLIGKESKTGEFERNSCHSLEYVGTYGEDESLFRLDVELAADGLQNYMIRTYPHNELQSQRFEVGYMLWL